MGEIIKVLGKKRINSEEFQIELNKPHMDGQQNSVHIQTKTFRIEMSQSEFNIIALNTLKAIQKLKTLKSL
tara:strand:+ start:812 stop:1024 length:213 start_codon:yes stop_codon:yes gene_type:complete